MNEAETFAQQWERACPPPFRGITWAEHDALPAVNQSRSPLFCDENPSDGKSQ